MAKKTDDVNLENTSVYKGDDIFINRELSWLDFNERVLHEAKNNDTPLLERLSFLSITQTNQDEFVSVRIAGLKDKVKDGDLSKDIAGLTAAEQLNQISLKMHDFVRKQYNTYSRKLLPRLKAENIYILDTDELSSEQLKYTQSYFNSTLYPVLTPMAVDQGRPFPLIANESQNIAALLQNEDKPEDELKFASLQVPSGIPRLLKLPVDQFSEENNLDSSETHCYILLEDVIDNHLKEIFVGFEIVAKCNYRIIRNADMEIDEEDTRNLLSEIEQQLRKRQWGDVIRLEVRDDVSQKILNLLIEHMHVDKEDIYRIPGPLDLSFLSKLSSDRELDYKKDLHYRPFYPQTPAMLVEESDRNIFSVIRERDIFLSLPYEKFDPVLDFVREAARDPNVLAIKQTLYRVSSNSPIISSLEEAVRNGKQVFVLLELKARFDEENNIEWARKLERAGAHVIYGLVGLKTHSKITMVVREEEDGIRRYVHLGTGNYHDKTAKGYTDTGLFTSADDYGSDATEFFNMLSAYNEPNGFKKLIVAPKWMRNTFYDLIDREILNAKAGKEAWVYAKMNSLEDQGMIEKLYEASAAGVNVRLIIRGICCLRAGVEGLSENIEVKSIVGRYLEHSRIYIFGNDGNPEYFMGSADWMGRNLDRRIEIIFPVEDEDSKNRIKEIIELQFADTERSHIMQADGSYKGVDKRGVERLDSMVAQEDLAIERSGEDLRSAYDSKFEIARSDENRNDTNVYEYSGLDGE